MPVCVECGAETPRDEMRGPPDELRCAACANRRYAVFQQPRLGARRVARRPVVTPALAVLSVVALLVQQSQPQLFSFAVAGFGEPLWRGEVWRLVTTTLLHGGIFHLAFNLYWLWLLGRAAEAWMGSLLFLGFFVLTAAGSTAAEIVITQPQAGLVGLSGVGYGLFGLLFALRRYKDFAAELMQPQTVRLFVGWFFFCFLINWMPQGMLGIGRVANVAHGAGALIGWMVGQAVLSRHRLVQLTAPVTLVLLLVGACVYTPWNGHYARYRAAEAVKVKDYDGALYWAEKAARTMAADPDLEEGIRWLRRQIDERPRHPQE